MKPLTIPTTWADDYCYATDPTLLAPCAAETSEIWLSYPQRAKWLANHTINEVEFDLANGMLVEALSGNDGTFYRLTGTRFDVYAQPRTGRHSAAPQAHITSVKPARSLSRTEAVRPRAVRLAPLWDEKYCDLADLRIKFAEGLQIVQRRRALREKARRGLNDTKVASWPRSRLHSAVRRRYQPLVRMLELLEQRSRLEGEIHGRGVVVAESQLEGQPVLWVQLDQKAAFAEGRHVAVTAGAMPHKTVDLRVQAIDMTRGRNRLALTAPRTRIEPGARIVLEQQGRFALGKHSAALRKFLDERVEGDWLHLAMLLSTPSRLPGATIEKLEYYFDNQLSVEQRTAVDGAVNSPHCYCIQGPPGTGKTTVITEVIRQLVARGERVLLLAPMHVAVDEVLRKVGDKPGVLALRISWEESRVSKELRRFLPDNVTRTYMAQARRPSNSQASRWRSEIGQLTSQFQVVDEYLIARAKHRDMVAGKQTAETEYSRHCIQLEAASAKAKADLLEGEQALQYYAGAVPQAAERAAALAEQLRAISPVQRLVARVRQSIGAENTTAQLSLAYRQADAEHRLLTDQQQAWTEHHAAAAGRLSRVTSERSAADVSHEAAVTSWAAMIRMAHIDAVSAAGRLRTLIRVEPTGVPEAEHTRWRDQLRASIRRLEHRVELEQRWFELSDMTNRNDHWAEQVDADLRRSANVVCCTTTGISKDLGDSDFDTLIVDEASRVVDSEFLIGAVRARRWILVGDEHQLPPYVEPNDEHHLHALSALHMTERNAADSLQSAVDLLGKMWIEDEELHQFRTETVLETAEALRTAQTWHKNYRRPYEAAWKQLRQLGESPEKTLLNTMHKHLVRSLMERCVDPQGDAVPEYFRQRLHVQRRMIAPIAELVSQPVYGGNYKTFEGLEVAPLLFGGTNTPVVFVDTSIYGEKARADQVESGFLNLLEADLISRICRAWESRLRRSKGEPITVSALTFYRAQATELRNRLGWPDHSDFRVLKFDVVDVIDKIQGQESDLVFLSFCRARTSNGRPSARYGRWLQDVRRLNVACTRARRALVLVGHEPTLRQLNGVPAAENFYRNLFGLLTARSDMAIAKGFR